jgi:hypothetical protein
VERAQDFVRRKLLRQRGGVDAQLPRPSFCEFVLGPILAVRHAALREQRPRLATLLGEVGVELPAAQLQELRGQALLRAAMQAWLPLRRALLGAIDAHFVVRQPPPGRAAPQPPPPCTVRVGRLVTTATGAGGGGVGGGEADGGSPSNAGGWGGPTTMVTLTGERLVVLARVGAGSGAMGLTCGARLVGDSQSTAPRRGRRRQRQAADAAWGEGGQRQPAQQLGGGSREAEATAEDTESGGGSPTRSQPPHGGHATVDDELLIDELGPDELEVTAIWRAGGAAVARAAAGACVLLELRRCQSPPPPPPHPAGVWADAALCACPCALRVRTAPAATASDDPPPPPRNVPGQGGQDSCDAEPRSARRWPPTGPREPTLLSVGLRSGPGPPGGPGSVSPRPAASARLHQLVHAAVLAHPGSRYHAAPPPSPWELSVHCVGEVQLCLLLAQVQAACAAVEVGLTISEARVALREGVAARGKRVATASSARGGRHSLCLSAQPLGEELHNALRGVDADGASSAQSSQSTSHHTAREADCSNADTRAKLRARLNALGKAQRSKLSLLSGNPLGPLRSAESLCRGWEGGPSGRPPAHSATSQGAVRPIPCPHCLDSVIRTGVTWVNLSQYGLIHPCLPTHRRQCAGGRPPDQPSGRHHQARPTQRAQPCAGVMTYILARAVFVLISRVCQSRLLCGCSYSHYADERSMPASHAENRCMACI